MLYKIRERLVCQRTELVNALRSCPDEFGHAFPQGIALLKRIETLVDDPNSEWPERVCKGGGRDLLIRISEISERIDIKARRIQDLAAETDTARRLQTMPGVGPITALAAEAFAPCMTRFKRGRDFAAWVWGSFRASIRQVEKNDWDVSQRPGRLISANS